MKRWVNVFKALSNVNRLKIIKFLHERGEKTVTEITEHLNISLNATSKHLLMLEKINILSSLGKKGHVFYFIDPKISEDVKKIIFIFISRQ